MTKRQSEKTRKVTIRDPRPNSSEEQQWQFFPTGEKDEHGAPTYFICNVDNLKCINHRAKQKGQVFSDFEATEPRCGGEDWPAVYRKPQYGDARCDQTGEWSWSVSRVDNTDPFTFQIKNQANNKYLLAQDTLVATTKKSQLSTTHWRIVSRPDTAKEELLGTPFYPYAWEIINEEWLPGIDSTRTWIDDAKSEVNPGGGALEWDPREVIETTTRTFTSRSELCHSWGAAVEVKSKFAGFKGKVEVKYGGELCKEDKLEDTVTTSTKDTRQCSLKKTPPNPPDKPAMNILCRIDEVTSQRGWKGDYMLEFADGRKEKLKVLKGPVFEHRIEKVYWCEPSCEPPFFPKVPPAKARL